MVCILYLSEGCFIELISSLFSLVLQLKAFLFAKKLMLAQLILVSKCTMQCRVQMAYASSVVKIN